MTDPLPPNETAGNPDGRLARLFADRLARNTMHFGGGGPGYFGVHLENIAPDGSELDLVLTFRAGHRYCCIEQGCHLAIGHEGFWEELREEMDAHGLADRPLPTFHLVRCVVEDGTLVDQGRTPRRVGPMAFEAGPFRPETADHERG